MLRVLSLFSGIGAFEKALDNIGIEYDLVNYCEIDSYASKAYSLIHGVPESKNLGDITKVDTSKLGKIDMVTYGFPCTDISIAGKMKGFEDEDGNTTRSGLFFEALRIIQDTKPKYAIAENVKNLMSKSFERELDIVLNSLGAAGYNNYCKVLNAKDYGIPQNRERVFIVSIRRDVDDFSFDFPKKETLELRMKDFLEKEVDEKYYMSDKTINTILSSGTKKFESLAENEDLLLNDKVIQIGNICPSSNRENPNQGRVYDHNGISPSLTTMECGNRQPMIIDDIYHSRNPRVYEEYAPTLRSSKCGELKVAEPVIEKVEGQKILIKENTKQGFAEAYEGDTINCEQPNSKTRRGRVGRGVAQTINTGTLQGVVVNESNNLRIRKLTPKECFRLMGFDDKDIDILVENKISNTQLYKMAGNSIVVNVLMGIFNKLLIDKTPSEPDLFSAFEIY